MEDVGIYMGPDGRLYCAPFDASTMLLIDPEPQAVSFIAGAGQGRMKYVDGRMQASS